MKTNIIKGDVLQAEMLANLKTEINKIRKEQNQIPGIAFVGFRNVPLGKYNIPFHVHTAEALGFKVFCEVLPDNAGERETFALIDSLNENENVHGIEILQPLPLHLNPLKIINRVTPEKEVEGFHPVHQMEILFPDLGRSRYPMCLPTALMELMDYYDLRIPAEAHWVLVMDDEFFDNPLVNMVTRTAFTKAVPKYSQLTIVNKRSGKMEAHCQQADYLVVVTKEPESIDPKCLKEGVFIIDIYSNLLKEIPSKNNPDKLIPIIRGGVNVKSVENIAGAIIPIPGGLMAVVMAVMLRNTLQAFKNKHQIV
jgi:methylenetetrahydrofolate dehydrogenase (NADP+)/methenyltetrahydrofolate cyclohydrolase